MEQLLIGRLCEELKLRGYSGATISAYQKNLELFGCEIGIEPDQIQVEDLKRYQLHLIDKGLRPQTINLRMAAVRFFFLHVVCRDWAINFIPRVKNPRQSPIILSDEEVLALLLATEDLKARTVFKVLYSTGMRIGEALSLQCKDIDSQRMVITIQKGKGGKSRVVPLSKFLLDSLRYYWRKYPTPKDHWLFPSVKDFKKATPTYWAGYMFRKAKRQAKIAKPGSCHLLRHCFATHLMELGTDIRVVQIILGHTQMSSTAIYTHLRNDQLKTIPNPLDVIVAKYKQAS